MELGVLFCDQVGSTALLTRLGDALAEEIRRDMFEVLHRAAGLCRGDVVKGSGDGLMVVFHSGAADALRCGELMIHMMHRLARRELWSEVTLKVGVSHGEAIFDKDDWYGAAVNLAARLCAAATSGQVLASAVIVHALAEVKSDWEQLPSLMLKGFPDPVPVRGQIVDDTDLPNWPVAVEFDVQGTAPLLGRDETLNELETIWRNAEAGSPQTVSVAGPAGVGVSRILGEFAHRVGPSAVQLSARSTSSVDVVQQLIRSHAAASLSSDLLADAGDDAAALTAICPLVGLRLGVAPMADADASDEDVFVRLLTRISRRAPLLVLLDGIAADRTLCRRMPTRSLTVSGARSDVAPGTARVISLDPLAPADVAALLAAFTPRGCSWTTSLVGLVVAETEGIPRDVVAVLDELSGTSAQGELHAAAVLDAVRRAVPYLGLQTFVGDDAVRFHGRDRAVQEVLACLAERSFVVVVGSSGSGKSSVVRAGCLPTLSSQGTDLVVLAPGEEPLRTLAIAWCNVRGGEPDQLLQQLKTDPSALTGPGDASNPVVLVIDQLEECFTVCTDEVSRDQFLSAITLPAPGVRVLATLRGDFFGRGSEHPGLAEALATGTVLMTPPTALELRTVIEAPAEAAQLRLEPGLSDLILTDVTDRPGSLPLLSHALRETWRRRRGRTLSVAGYREAGGATGAIARTADTVYERLTASERNAARRIFLRLTALGEGAEDSRRRVPIDVLLASGTEESRRVLHTLTSARLVTADTDAEGRDIDELAHEALLREWPRLRGWLDEDRDELRLLSHLESAATEWEQSGRIEGDLYSDRRLDTVEDIDPDKLNDRETAYLAASINQREVRRRAGRRATRRLQTLAGVLVVLLVAAVVATGLAFVQRGNALRQANQALASRLAAETSSVLGAQPDLALLLAVQANRVHRQFDTKSALVTALGHVGPLVTLHQELGNDLVEGVLNPDGRTVAAIYADGRFQFWDLVTRRPSVVQPSPVRGTPTDVRFSRDGTLVAVATVDDTNRSSLDVRDTASGAPVGHTIPAFGSEPNGQITVLAISPDDRFIAADAFDTNSVAIWRINDGYQTVAPVRLTDAGVQDVRYSPDGSSVLVALYSGSLARIDAATGTPLGPPVPVFDGNGGAMEVASTGPLVAMADLTGHIAIINYTTGKVVVGPASIDDPAGAVAFTSDRKSLIVGGASGTVVELDAKTLTPQGLPFTGHTGTITTLAIQGSRLTTFSGQEVAQWDLSGGLAIASAIPANTEALGASVDTHNRQLATVGVDPEALVWPLSHQLQPSAAARLGGIALPAGEHSALAGDGSRVAVDSAIVASDGAVSASTLDIFSLPERRHLGRLDLGHVVVHGIAFSPDGSALAVVTHSQQGAGLGTLLILSAADLHLIARAKNVPSDVVVWPTPTGIVVGQGTLIDVLDPSTARRKLPRYTSSSEVQSAATTAAGGDVLFGRVDGSLLKLDPVTGHETGIVATGLGSPVTAVGVSSDGRVAAAGTESGSLALVDMLDRRVIGDPTSTGADAFVGAFVDDKGEHVLTVDRSGRILEWAINETSWRAAACARAGRNMTKAEWSRYVGGRYSKTCSMWPPGTD